MTSNLPTTEMTTPETTPEFQVPSRKTGSEGVRSWLTTGSTDEVSDSFVTGAKNNEITDQSYWILVIGTFYLIYIN